MGPEFALLRQEFRLFESKKVIRNEIKDIMITMGGSDRKKYDRNYFEMGIKIAKIK